MLHLCTISFEIVDKETAKVLKYIQSVEVSVDPVETFDLSVDIVLTVDNSSTTVIDTLDS